MSTESNKREYFRIDDEVFLSTKKVDLSDIDSVDTYFHGFRENTLFTAKFHQQRTAMLPNMAQIKARDSVVAEYIIMLSDQIDVLAGKLMKETLFAPDEQLKKVNMSAGGMSFYSDHQYNEGDVLEHIFAIFPGGHYIAVLAEVARSEWIEELGNYSVSVNYTNIHSDDKELIIQHNLFLQRQQLQKKRLES